MAPAPKGKPPTKGSKQILVENAATVKFYRNMSMAATSFYGIITALFYYENISNWVLFFNVLVLIIHIACYQLMMYISKPRYLNNTQLLDPGLDLNMEGGMGEHIKDIVILSSITQVLALINNYFWLLLLILPIRVFWLLWTNILGPWFFQEAPENTEKDEKKKKKMERKYKRSLLQ